VLVGLPEVSGAAHTPSRHAQPSHLMRWLGWCTKEGLLPQATWQGRSGRGLLGTTWRVRTPSRGNRGSGPPAWPWSPGHHAAGPDPFPGE
jgi:hypothetical protein